MKQIMLIALVFIGFLLLAGCGTKPQDVAQSFFAAIEQQDFNMAKQYVTQDSQNMLEHLRTLYADNQRAESEGLAKMVFKIQSTKVDKQIATVTFQGDKNWKKGPIASDETTTQEVKMVMENGMWKVKLEP